MNSPPILEPIVVVPTVGLGCSLRNFDPWPTESLAQPGIGEATIPLAGNGRGMSVVLLEAWFSVDHLNSGF